MAFTVSTLQETFDRIIGFFESRLGGTVPLSDKSPLRVFASAFAQEMVSVFKYAADRVRQVLALTATGDDLDLIGQNFSVIRRVAVADEVTVVITGTNGVIIPATRTFVSVRGARYQVVASATISGGIATFNLKSDTPGADNNLVLSDILTIGAQIAGAASIATVTVLVTAGANEETDATYRGRVLNAERGQPGGNNTFDYKTWSEEVSGVEEAYPFSGKPSDDPTPDVPGDRTVYIEANTSVDPDGIPTSAILTSVRASITADPATGISRPSLGLTDSTLFVEAISRTVFDVDITGIAVDGAIETQVKTEISAALTQYFLDAKPFVEGIGVSQTSTNPITNFTISQTVQDVLGPNKGSASTIAFNKFGSPSVNSYPLVPGEHAKLGAITYA